MRAIFMIFTFVTFLSGYALVAEAAEAPRIVSLSVDGMYSNACPALLKSAVRKIKGVKSVEASLETKSARIEFDESVTSLKAIQETITDQVGFKTALK